MACTLDGVREVDGVGEVDGVREVDAVGEVDGVRARWPARSMACALDSERARRMRERDGVHDLACASGHTDRAKRDNRLRQAVSREIAEEI